MTRVSRINAKIVAIAIVSAVAVAAVVADAARAAKMNQVVEFEDVKTATPALKQFLKAGDAVLFKASRAARLERLIEAWQSEEAKA